MAQQKILMCPPDYYGVAYEINPWMKVSNQPNKTLARLQWQTMKQTLEQTGLLVVLMPPVPGLPDLVFTANGGLRYYGGVILSNFKYPERQKEIIHFVNFFVFQKYACGWLPPGIFFEGEGDALFCGEKLVCGYGMRSDKRGITTVAKIIGKEPILLKLIDPYFYHLDTCFCYPKKDLVLCHLPAFNKSSRE
ncbi:amidinotransferase, partial [Patescibacteria group bacterium]|nr:amidinotransferase [Patescibacteria group bacterium]